jgi:hypothetical protein
VTAEERHAYLVSLGVQAVAMAIDDHQVKRPLNERIAAHMSERMAQAAQAWTCEVDGAQ